MICSLEIPFLLTIPRPAALTTTAALTTHNTAISVFVELKGSNSEVAEARRLLGIANGS